MTDRGRTIIGNLNKIFLDDSSKSIFHAAVVPPVTDDKLKSIASVLSDKYFDPKQFTATVAAGKTAKIMEEKLESKDTIAPSCTEKSGCPRTKWHNTLLKKYDGKINIKHHETPEKTVNGEGTPIVGNHNVRLLWSGFREGAQYVATLFGVLFTKSLGVSRAIEQTAATQKATDEIGNWEEGTKSFPEFFAKAPPSQNGLNSDDSKKILSFMWDDFSRKFAGMEGFDITIFCCPLSIADRLSETTFFREELPALNTTFFAVILYDIEAGDKFILYNVVFEGDGGIQVIRLDSNPSSVDVNEINIMVGNFPSGENAKKKIRDFLLNLSKHDVSERSGALPKLLRTVISVQGGGRRKYKRKGRNKKKSKRRKSKRRKYKRRKSKRRKSKLK